jgi:hypothetical protein
MDIHSQDVRFVVGLEGKPTAVLVDIGLWERIIEALEDAEDISLAKEALIALDAAGGDPTKAGFLSWSDVKDELERMDGTEE